MMIEDLFQTLGKVLSRDIQNEPVVAQVTFKNLIQYHVFINLMEQAECAERLESFTIQRMGASDDG
tara:strand:+ start:2330 stop:2527 length:198 start_codon:yes stop_codon:yes gene_type:complete